MTAAELHEALKGVPEEALCGTIELDVDCWCDSVGTPMTTNRAAALLPDADEDATLYQTATVAEEME